MSTEHETLAATNFLRDVLGLPLDATNTARLNGVGMDMHQYLGYKLAIVLDMPLRTVTL